MSFVKYIANVKTLNDLNIYGMRILKFTVLVYYALQTFTIFHSNLA